MQHIVYFNSHLQANSEYPFEVRCEKVSDETMPSMQVWITMIAIIVESVSMAADLSYKTYSKCNATIHELVASKFLVSSEQYPNAQNESMDCFLHLIVPPGHKMLITFVDLDINKGTESKDCDRDFVALYPINSSLKVLRLCGQLSKLDSLQSQNDTEFYFDFNRNFILSHNNSLTIHFHTESSDHYNDRSFKFLIETVLSCRNVTLIAQLNTANEYCSFRNYPLTYFRENDLCSIQIVANEQYRNTEKGNYTNTSTNTVHQIYLQFTAFNVSDSRMRNGDDFCENDSFIEIKSETQKLKLCGYLSEEESNSSVFQMQSDDVTITVNVNSKSLRKISYNTLKVNDSMGFCFRYKLLANEQSVETVSKEMCSVTNGWHRWNSYCYKIISHLSYTWNEARNHCASNYGGHLVSIVNDKVQQYIEKLILREKDKWIENGMEAGNNFSSFWIGANDKKHENSFQWDDGQPFTYSNWFNGWPNSGSSSSELKYGKQPSDDGYSDQDCVEMRNHFHFPTKGIGNTGEQYFWNDIFCNATNAFICQISDRRQPPYSKGSSDSNDSVNNDAHLSKRCIPKTIELTEYHPWDTVVSPNYPDSYPNNYDCTILVKTSPGFVIELLFTDFLLEDGGNSCAYDFVDVTALSESDFDNQTKHTFVENNEAMQNKRRKYCGDWTSRIKLLRVVSASIALRFKSDDSHSYRGFRGELRAFSRTSIQEQHNEAKAHCDDDRFQYFKGSCFLVSSFPEVSWQTAFQICSDLDSQMLSIENLDEEKKLFNFLRFNSVRTGNDLQRLTRAFWLKNVDANLIPDSEKDDSQAFGDHWFPNEYEYANYKEKNKRTDTNGVNKMNSCITVTVDTIQKKKLGYNRFSCQKQAGYICIKRSLDMLKSENKTIENKLYGTITSPNYPSHYINNVDYNVTIKTNNTNSVVLIWFDFLDIEPQSDCLYDYLMMKERFRSEKLCGQIENNDNLSLITYISKENIVSLLFHSDFSIRGFGFKAHWRIIAMNWCRRHNAAAIHINDSGVIESPGYPEWSLPSLDCSITLTADPGSKILLTLMDFDLGEAKKTLKPDKCENVFHSNSDYVRIDVDDGKSITVCGSTSSNGPIVGEQYLSFANKLRLHYTTHERSYRTTFIKRRGFKFRYSVISNTTTSVTTVLRPKEDTVGTINNLNFPYSTPKGIENIVFIRTKIGSNIEIRPSKWTQMIIKDEPCASNERDTTIKIIDAFGDTSVLPATTRFWTVCRLSLNTDSHFVNKESISHGLLHRRPVKSAFHVMTITVTAAVHNTHSAIFQFMYKTKKDEDLKNVTMYLPKDYPIDTCVYEPCSSHGRCVRKKLRDEMVDICDCSMHYTGLFCHLTLCDLKPCGDFGVCTLEPKEDNYVCHCNTGYTGKQCMDTISTCDRTNPCGDRGKCSLINGTPRCKCYAWYEGKYCERFRVRIQYKPLSQRMLEEPFWLGLITVAVVLALICLVYCLKKKFAERIEKFFAEEIERSKTQTFGMVETGSAPRYSLTSNVGVSLNVTPIHNSPPMTRSRSSIIGRLCKHGIRNTPGHLSDSEVVHHNEDFSDTESSMNKHRKRFPSLTFFSQRSMLSSTLALNQSQEKEETSRILASLVGGGLTKDDNRRMSLDDFFKMSEAKIRQKRLRSQFADRYLNDPDGTSPNATDSETSFSFQRTVPSIAEFHVITETSHEEEDSVESGGITISSLPSLLKQESESETLLSNIQQIQKLSRSRCSVNDMEESGGHQRLVRSLSPRRPPSGFSSSTNSSTTSTDNSPNHQPLPEITITQAVIESTEREMEKEETLICGEYEDEDNETIEIKSLKPDILSIPGEGFPVRRLSAPNPAYISDNKEQQSPGSQSYDSPVFKKYNQPLPLRKYSLELSVPKITINAGLHGFVDGEKFESPPQSAKGGQSFQALTIMHSSCDRTISESNLSTSGYSSLSSPGISRCNSSSPIPDEMVPMGSHVQYPTFTIPEAPDEISVKDMSPESKSVKQKSTYGNFLTIPVIAYPVNRPSSPKRKAKERSLEKLNKFEEEMEMKVYKGAPKKSISLNVNTKRDRLIAMRQQYKTIAPSGHDYSPHENFDTQISPSRMFINEQFEKGSKDVPKILYERSSSKERNKIQRNPSWPGYLKTTSSDSEETDASCRSFSRMSDNPRKPIKKSVSKSYSLCSPTSPTPPIHKTSKKLTRRSYKTLAELRKYDSADRSSSSPRTSSKDLEKYSSSDSLLSLNDENLITVRSVKSLNRFSFSDSPRRQLPPQADRFRRANSEVVYFADDYDYDGDDTDQEQTEKEMINLSRSFPAFIDKEQPPSPMFLKPPKRSPRSRSPRRSVYRSVPVSPSVDHIHNVGLNACNSPDFIQITLQKPEFQIDYESESLSSDNFDKDLLKSPPPEEDTTSDEAGSERTVLLRKPSESNVAV